MSTFPSPPSAQQGFESPKVVKGCQIQCNRGSMIQHDGRQKVPAFGRVWSGVDGRMEKMWMGPLLIGDQKKIFFYLYVVMGSVRPVNEEWGTYFMDT